MRNHEYELAAFKEKLNVLDLNAEKMVIANERKHGTTKQRPKDIFLRDEANILKSLPDKAYEIEEYHRGKVRKDGHVRFRNKYYSVGEAY